ncbi:uncharacterized protein SOCEGT47_033680 [Sorangium cellulosum]|uniref:Uncharacterized protein n=1 Tax=Sorangium cellulosum TaxID=56 RepID=A0A4V0NDJ1_SORCE|nr:hypothetical protein [Sorangium cellulosum]AUX22852.1 uncharacterized protein SOCEGT47_033680 [Sorangium cellulosum]
MGCAGRPMALRRRPPGLAGVQEVDGLLDGELEAEPTCGETTDVAVVLGEHVG